MRSVFPAHVPRRRRLFVLLPLLLGWLASGSLFAQQQDDLRRALELRSQQEAVERERDLLKEERDSDRPTISVDGRTYTVEHTANDLGRALYLSLQHRQWLAAARFLDEYLTLPDHDPLLVHHAKGALARVQGHYAEAEKEYRQLLAAQPEFAPARLELARVLFEDNQDREAAAEFAAASALLDPAHPGAEGVARTIQTFTQALDNRSAWNGSVALGPTWNDNVNRTSAAHICLLAMNGVCYFDTKTPAPIMSVGLDYDANLNKRLALRGHHGLYVRSLLLGQSYRDNSRYNELTSTTQAGYSFRSGRHSIALAPSFDYYAVGGDALYGAWGLHGEWSWTASARSLLKLEGDWKDMRYRNVSNAANYDGITRSAYLTWFQGLSTRWTVFGGVDVMDSKAPLETGSYLQKGVRLGASLQWPEGVSTTLFASYRTRDYGAYSPVFGMRREEDEQNYMLVIKAARWKVAGFTPLLTLRHNTFGSNIDWLYAYDKNVASLKLERTF